MKIRLEHDEIEKAIRLYIHEIYGEKAGAVIIITEIKPGDKTSYTDPPAYRLEADIKMEPDP